MIPLSFPLLFTTMKNHSILSKGLPCYRLSMEGNIHTLPVVLLATSCPGTVTHQPHQLLLHYSKCGRHILPLVSMVMAVPRLVVIHGRQTWRRDHRFRIIVSMLDSSYSYEDISSYVMREIPMQVSTWREYGMMDWIWAEVAVVEWKCFD